MKKYIVAVLFAATLLSYSQEKSTSNLWASDRPDGHAPISIMGDHTHHKGEFMFSYRSMFMNMNDLTQGNKDSNISAVHSNYMVAPKNMDMTMHMLGAMYAPSDKLTFMVMANYIENDMTLIMRNGMKFSTNSEGFGDVTISGLYNLFNKNRKAMHAQLGLIIPTGSIDKTDVTPMSAGNTVQLPYPMQTGSGSFGAKFGLTFLGQQDKFSWGNQFTSVIMLNDNDQDYKMGNSYALNNWIAAQAGKNLSVSFRLEGALINKINGTSPLLNSMMVSTADTRNSGGIYVNTGFGLNYLVRRGSLKGFRLAEEISAPVYKDLNGVQLRTNYNLIVGAQYAFH
ncbi:transporter [Gaetbulibacter aestuarii]|uniref:Transporter n=1 Tax=Gaetbulibacter aestuarii TaxID=1502358 RepID=A0ABW7MW22_9FLAO